MYIIQRQKVKTSTRESGQHQFDIPEQVEKTIESLASPVMEAEEVESTTPVQSSSQELEVWAYEKLREEYGF